MEQQVSTGLPTKTYMRKPLNMNNPTVIKSSDGKIYKQTGNVVALPYVRPKGQVFVPPPNAIATAQAATTFGILEPFRALMSKAVQKKGFNAPSDIADLTRLFYNQIIGAKGFNGTVPLNFESMDNADAQTGSDIIDQTLTYIRSLVNDVMPNGQPLTTQDAALAPDAKAVVQTLAAKVVNSGMSPTDMVAAGGTMSTPPAIVTPFYSTPMFKNVAIGIIVLIVFYTLVK